MMKQETDWAWGIGAVSTRIPFESEVRSKTGMARIVDTCCRPAWDDAPRDEDHREARRDRLGASDGNDLPALIAALILVGAVVILGYATLVGSRSSAFHAIGAGSIAVVVGFSLVVLITLQFPFSGGLAVDPGPFREGAFAQFLAPSRSSA
jgi:hypothetical protein